jgi:two-component system OmpR family sensor kinase
MDGPEARLTNSLQYRLSLWLAAAILISALAAGAFSFGAAFWEANQIQDGQLHEVAALVTSDNIDVMARGSAHYVPSIEPEAKVIVQRFPDHEQMHGALFGLPPGLADGIHTVPIGGLEWRVILKTIDAHTRVAVGQQTADRNEIARNSAVATLIPFVVLVPVLLAIVAVLVRRMFKPLARLAAELDNRSEHDLAPVASPLDTRLPTEITPFVVANNRLLARVARAVELQRRFVADAAHELRSPLTALKLQLELLRRADDAETREAARIAIGEGIGRASRLVEQLLALARSEPDAVLPVERVDLAAVARQAIDDTTPFADSRSVSIALIAHGGACVKGDPVALNLLVRNLVDNAVRYSPTASRVEVRVRQQSGEVVLEVDDAGPGIPDAERERVFDRFYRRADAAGAGSGLGLAIVRSVASAHAATVRLGPSTLGGLRVSVSFPATP